MRQANAREDRRMATSEKGSAIQSKRIVRKAPANEIPSRTVASTFVGLLLVSEGPRGGKVRISGAEEVSEWFCFQECLVPKGIAL